VKTLQEEAALRKRNIDLGLYMLTNDPQNPMHAPGPLTAPPDLDFSALDQSITALSVAAAQYHSVTTKIPALSAEKRKALNADLALAERRLTSEQGLPSRPWVRHLLYAPGTYTGYGAKTIPGVREALEQGRYQEAQEQLAVVSKALANEAAFIEKIASEFTAAAQ
jgi:N-acetylated-alpha-linked acidic dipeptidase